MRTRHVFRHAVFALAVGLLAACTSCWIAAGGQGPGHDRLAGDHAVAE
jgi:hypothetical protein